MAKVNTNTLKELLSAGPKNVRELADALKASGNAAAGNPWDLEKDLKDKEAGFRAMKDDGNMEYVPFTIFPARERARYGFPEIAPEIKGRNPDVKERTRKDKDGNPLPRGPEQNQYWPVVAWGEITPTEVGEAYDGRYDAVVEHLDEVLGIEFAEWLAENGYSAEFEVRGVRGGVSIRLKTLDTTDDTAPVK